MQWLTHLSYLDDGLRLVALDPATGKVLHHRELTGAPVGVLEAPENAEQLKSKNSQNWQDYKTFLAADRSDSFTMEGGLVGVMSADQDSIFMRQMRFSRTLEPQNEPRQHLFSTSSLLDGSEHHRTYWILGSGDFSGLPVAFPWIAGSRLQVPFGLQMAFDEHTVWSIRGGAGRKRQDPDYRVVTSARPAPSDPESGYPDFAERRSGNDASKPNSGANRADRPDSAGSPSGVSWQADLDARPRAIVRAGAHLFVGGTRDTGYDTALDQWNAGRVTALDCRSGVVLHRVEMDAPPVWDGIAAADDRLYAALEDGHVVCLAE